MKKTPALLASTAAGLAAVVALHHQVPPVSLALPAGPGTSPTTSTSPSSGPTVSTRAGALLSATGTSEQYGYGVLSVKVTVKGHRIMDVTMANLQTAESYSQQLAQQVIPMLRTEVLSAQSAKVSTISGATYTSEAYLYSLQSALNRLHL